MFGAHVHTHNTRCVCLLFLCMSVYINTIEEGWFYVKILFNWGDHESSSGLGLPRNRQSIYTEVSKV